MYDPCERYYEDHRLCSRCCSPIGMKKPFPTVFDASAGNFQEIYVSGGRIGLTLKVPVADLLKVTGGKLAAITAEE